jgi:hypothetical protein
VTFKVQFELEVLFVMPSNFSVESNLLLAKLTVELHSFALLLMVAIPFAVLKISSWFFVVPLDFNIKQYADISSVN